MARPDQYVAARSSKPASETASTKALVRSGVMAIPAARRRLLKPTSTSSAAGVPARVICGYRARIAASARRTRSASSRYLSTAPRVSAADATSSCS